MGHLLDRRPALLTHAAGFTSVSLSRARTESDPGVPSRDVNDVLPEQNEDNIELARPLTPPTPSPLRPTLKKSVSSYHGLSEGTSKGTGTDFRNLLMMTILSTDMSVHFQWLPKFEELLHRLQRSNGQTDEEEDDLGKVTEDVDGHTRLLLCQALIKCADISNPVGAPV